MRSNTFLLLPLLVIFLNGCSHPLEIHGTGEGDIVSASGTRDCLQEDYDSAATDCTENLVVGAYAETYTALPREGSQFHGWVNCQIPAGKDCSFSVPEAKVIDAWGKTATPLKAMFRTVIPTGKDYLMIGGSIFTELSEPFEAATLGLGLIDHSSTQFSTGTLQGAPLAIWNDPLHSAQVKAILDKGDISVVGMTYHTDHPTAEGYINWVRYALDKNPDTRFYIGIPWPLNPGSMTLAQFEFTADVIQNKVHGLIDELRNTFPGVDFYDIPYGEAAVQLWDLWAVSGFPFMYGDEVDLIGSEADAIFRDAQGRPGDILKETALLVSLYVTHNFPGFIRILDLKFASPGYIYPQVTRNHDSAYTPPPEIRSDTNADGTSDYVDLDDDGDGVPDTHDSCPFHGPDVLGNGCPLPRQPIRVSENDAGVKGSKSSNAADISGDGNLIVFYSSAENLADGLPLNTTQAFVYNKLLDDLQLISVDTEGAPGTLSSFVTAISANGRYAVFESSAPNLVAIEPNAEKSIYRRDLLTGTTVRVSLDNAGNARKGIFGDISGDGRYIVFQSDDTDLVSGDTNNQNDVFLRDMQSNTTIRMSVASDGSEGNGYSRLPHISDNGQFVTFSSSASNLVPNDTNDSSDLFLYQISTAAIQRISLSNDGNQANDGSSSGRISADGRYVSFRSSASNLVDKDNNQQQDLFVRDTVAGTTERVNISGAGNVEGIASQHDISGDGRYIAFSSGSPDLVAQDTNETLDIFVHDRISGRTHRINTIDYDTQANDFSTAPLISADGSAVTYTTRAGNLHPDGIVDLYSDVYVQGMP